jgi:glycerol kinase
VKVERPGPNSIKPNHTSSSLSDIVSAGVGATLKLKTRSQIGGAELQPIKMPSVSISGDLDSADEEDLFLELRKVEILQKLKKIRKLKLNYY